MQAQLQWCQDAQVGATLAEARQCAWGDAPRASQRLQAHRLWARVRIPSARGGMVRHTIHVGPHVVPQVTVFAPVHAGSREDAEGPAESVSSVLAGHQVVTDPRYLEPLGYRFSVDGSASPVDVYLRFDAPLPPALWVEVHAGEEDDTARDLLLGLHLGLLACLLLMAVLAALVSPQPVTRRFALLMAVVVLNVATASGLLALMGLWRWPAWSQCLLHALVLLRLSLWLGVIQALLAGHTVPRWIRPLAVAGHGAVALGIAAGLGGLFWPGQVVMFAGPLLLASGFWLAVWRTAHMATVLRWALLADFALLVINLICLVLATEFNPPGLKLPLVATRATDLGNAVAMLVLVLVNHRISRRDLEQARLSLAQVQLQSQYERRLQAQRDTVMHMLGHELKNALAAIRMAARNLLPDLAPGARSARRRLEHIETSVQTMNAILARGLLAGPADAGGNTDPEQGGWVRAVPTDLLPLLLSLLPQHPEGGRVQVLSTLTGPVVTDPQLLAVVCSSLLHNSLRYSPGGTPVRVFLESTPSALAGRQVARICITNQVPLGLRLDEAALFKHAYRHPTHDASEGTGLGLALVRKLCALLGGSIVFRQQEDQVQFSLELPQ